MPRGENFKGRRLPNAGRKPGSQNKVTVELKQMIEGALLEAGGQKYLLNLARKRPEVFVPLLARLLPKQLEHSGDLNHHVDFRERMEAARRRLEEGRRVREQEEVVRPDFLKEAV